VLTAMKAGMVTGKIKDCMGMRKQTWDDVVNSVECSVAAFYEKIHCWNLGLHPTEAFAAEHGLPWVELTSPRQIAQQRTDPAVALRVVQAAEVALYERTVLQPLGINFRDAVVDMTTGVVTHPMSAVDVERIRCRVQVVVENDPELRMAVRNFTTLQFQNVDHFKSAALTRVFNWGKTHTRWLEATFSLWRGFGMCRPLAGFGAMLASTIKTTVSKAEAARNIRRWAAAHILPYTESGAGGRSYIESEIRSRRVKVTVPDCFTDCFASDSVVNIVANMG
jgi:hypothetical protein